MLWAQFCLVEVFVWEVFLHLTQVVLEHGSATVSFEQYQSVLERTGTASHAQVTLLADRVLSMGT